MMQQFGFISVIFLVFALTFLEVKWGPDYTKTFSRLVARQRASIVYYFMIFSIFLVLFSLYVTGWLIPTLELPLLFTVVYFTGIVSQFMCVTVPETGELKTKIHIAAAGLMSASALAQVALLLMIAPQPSRLSLSVYICSLLIMTLTWVVYSARLQIRKYELAWQAVYFVGYLTSMVIAGFMI